MKDLSYLITAIIWVLGIMIAKGFWSTLFAVCMPLWGLYLVIEQVLIRSGVVL